MAFDVSFRLQQPVLANPHLNLDWGRPFRTLDTYPAHPDAARVKILWFREYPWEQRLFER